MNVVSIDEYHQARAKLIATERSLRYDHQQAYKELLLSGDNLSLDEQRQRLQQANNIVRAIRIAEHKSVWQNEADLTVPHIFPGMEFLTAKSIIERTRLFEVVKKLPKGALLHAHMDAMCDAGFLLNEALKYPQMHVRTPKPVSSVSITAESLQCLPEFCALPSNFKSDRSLPNAGLTSPEYEPNSWIPVHSARDNFSHGGPKGFDEWVLAGMRLDPVEAYQLYNTSIKIWKKFQSTFMVAGGLLRFEPVLAAYFREILRSSVEDGISYIETRINFFSKTMIRENGIDDFTHREWVISYAKALDDFRTELKIQGREDEFVGAKIIYTTLRIITPEELEWYLDDCFELKKEFPDLIAGFDLVGQEDTGYPLLHYLPQLLNFKRKVQESSINLPFIFHAGETLGDGDKVDDNLFDAILLGTKRIGHGFSMAKHPHLMEVCRKSSIALEVCPISNEILRLTSSMPTHPLPVLLNNGVPVVLACDDPAMFGNLGLSYDFFQIIVSSEINTLTTLGVMAVQSIEHSSLSNQQKEEALSKWKKRWAKFVDYVLSLETADPSKQY